MTMYNFCINSWKNRVFTVNPIIEKETFTIEALEFFWAFFATALLLHYCDDHFLHCFLKLLTVLEEVRREEYSISRNNRWLGFITKLIQHKELVNGATRVRVYTFSE